MSSFLVAIALILAVLALIAELAIARREKRVRIELEQPLDSVGKERKRLYRLLFVTTILSSLFGLALAGAHRQWVVPVQGVAIVMDTAPLSSEATPPASLEIEKGAVRELIRALPGVTLSLYELRGGAVHQIVPPTIDLLFFELQLDGILPSPPSMNALTLSSIHNDVVGRYPGIHPWVAIVSSKSLEKGEGLDGVASIEVQGQTVVGTVYEGQFPSKGLTLQGVATKIVERLNRSTIPLPADPTESFLLILSTGVAFLCFVLWRREIVPLCSLGLFIAACAPAFSQTEVEANSLATDARHLAEASDFQASQKVIDSLLTTVSEKEARRRLQYDRALLSYLQKRDEEALAWLDMESTQPRKNVLVESETLRGLVLSRLVTESSNDAEQQERKRLLEAWLSKKPKVEGSVLLTARIALLSLPVGVFEYDAARQTVLWYEESAQGAPKEGVSSLTSAAYALTRDMQSRIEQRLLERWSKGVAELFSISPSSSISTLRIWFDIANCSTVNEGVCFLLDQAAMSSNMAVYFPHTGDSSNDLTLVSSVLAKAQPFLSETERRSLSWLLSMPTKEKEYGAAVWYARSVLFPVMGSIDRNEIKPVALLLCHEVDASTSLLVRKTLASLLSSALGISSSVSPGQDPLPGLVQKALAAWYAEDPEGALDTVIQLTEESPSKWNQRLFSLISPSIVKAKKDGRSVSSLVARGIGEDLSSLDPVLTGRLWQIAQSSVTTPQSLRLYVDHLVLLFSELSTRLSAITDPALRSFVLIFSIQPSLFEQLNSAEIFDKNPEKRAIYDQLLKEWNDRCVAVEQRIADPTLFRLSKVQQEIDESVEILRRLQALLKESAAPVAVMPKPLPVSAIETPTTFSIQGEDAIRLFQEMDRADRELFGE